MRIEPWWLPKRLVTGLQDLSISEQGLEWFGGDSSSSSSLALEEIAGARTRRRILWTKIVIETRTAGTAVDLSIRGRPLCFSGFAAAQAARFVALVSSLAAGARLHELTAAIDAARDSWDRPDGKDQYMTVPLHEEWRSSHAQLRLETQDLLNRNPPETEVSKRATQFVEIWCAGESARTNRNAYWMSRQRAAHSDLFANAMGYPLNEDQITAILRDEHRSLVVAGAGTGKTTTVVAKTKWIISQRLAAPDRIRILAFNTKAAAEVSARLQGDMGAESIASTFHSLGLSLVAQGRGRKPRLTRLLEDPRLLQRFIRSCLDEALSSPTHFEKVANFLFYFRYPEPNPVPARGSHEELRFAEGHEIRTLTGVKVRSNSEAAIANWLTLNGIQWEYEASYPIDTATIQHGQYHPDFLLPEHGIYIEHWSCGHDGRFPPDWTYDEIHDYREAMTWKRALHERQGTRLVETHSSRHTHRDIVKVLERELLRLGVTPSLLNDEARRALLVEDSVIKPVVTLLERFLALFRESDLSLSDMLSEATTRHDERGMAFLAMFDVIHAAYVAHLRDEDAIDYSNMIREAASAIRAGKARLSIDYLIVDEFQDLSRGRADLLKALLTANARCRLIAVGDDWQSIYRFAGSDMRLMVDFENEFGTTARSDLQHTQRFGDKLVDATSRFIEMNPRQLRKTLIAARTDAVPALEIIGTRSFRLDPPSAGWPAKSGEPAMAVRDRDERIGHYHAKEVPSIGEQSTIALIDKLLRRISKERTEASVLVLGRYNYLLHEIENRLAVPSNVKLSLSTVHKAKGLEADFVVILAVVTGPFGFPTEIEDDPLLNLILPSAVDYPNAEERRLFYVAMTRARSKVFIITQVDARSAFIDELQGADYAGLVLGSVAFSSVLNCPECRGGILVLRTGKHGAYLRCAHDRCRGKALRCPRCGGDGFVRGQAKHQCQFCSYAADNCPNCKRGYLKHVSGGVSRDRGLPFDAFDACSTNRREPEHMCFTRKCACS